MATFTKNDQVLMEDAFFNALNRWNKKSGGFGNSGGSAPGSPNPGQSNPAQSSGMFEKALKNLTKEVTSTTGGFVNTFLDISGKLVRGGAKVSDVTGSLQRNFEAAGREGSNLSAALGKAGVALDEVVTYVEEGIDVFRDLSSSGASFNNAVIEMRVGAANTRMTLDEYSSVIKNNSKNLAGLGSTINSGVKIFNDFSKAFFDNSELADELKNMGYTTRDLNEILAINLANNKITKQLEGAARNEQIQAAANLAREMDLVAKITGKSRKEQEDELRKQQENGQVRAAIELAVAKGGDSVRQAFTTLSTASKIGGEDFKRLQEEIFAMGRPSQEMAEKFALAGGAAQKLMFDAAAAAKRGDDAAAKRLTQEAAAAYAQQQMSKANLSIASQGYQAAVDGVSASRQLTDSMKAVAKENNLDLNNAADRNKVLDIIFNDVKKSQEKVEGATKTVIAAEGRLADAAAAINNVFVDKVNKAADPALARFAKYLGSSTEGLGNLRDKLETPFMEALEKERTRSNDQNSLKDAIIKGAESSTKDLENDRIRQAIKDLDAVISSGGARQDRAVEKLNEIAKAQGKTKEEYVQEVISRADINEIKKLTQAVDVMRKTTREGVAAPSSIRNTREQQGKGRTISEALVDSGTELYAKGLIGLENMFKTGEAQVKVTNLNDISINPQVNASKQRKTGTLGETGNLFENFGDKELVELHGIEGVMKPDQLADIVEKTANSAVKGSMVGTSSGLDLNSISKDINTKFSSVKTSETVSSGTTTTTQVQTEDSKKAAEELAKIEKQFQQDWRSRSKIVKESLAVEDQKFSKIQAAMKTDQEAIKLKEDVEAKRKELEKRINDGISIEIKRKNEALETSKQFVKEELSYVDFNKKESLSLQKSITKQQVDLKKDEIKEILEQAKLAKNLVGKEMSGLSGEMIDKIISDAGADINDFYIDATVAGKETLKSFSVDYANSLKKLEVNPAKVDPAKVDPAKVDPAINRSIDFGKIGLSDQQKKVFDEMMSMSSEESKKKLENLKIEQEAAAKINSITSKQRDEMEERFEKEGKLAELESNEEYKRLTEQLNASFALSKEKKKEVDAAVQAENTRSNIAKLYGKSLDELKISQKNTTEELVNNQKIAAAEIEKNSELTKTAITGAVPVSEIKKTTNDLTSGLTNLQKDFFNVLIEQDEKSLKLKEGSYKKQIEADAENLKKADEEIASVKSQIENSTSDTEKRRLGHRLNSLEKERAATEDAKKFAEENLEVAKRAIEAKKGEIKVAEEIITATNEKSALDSNILKASNDINNELPVKTQEVNKVEAEESKAQETIELEKKKKELELAITRGKTEDISKLNREIGELESKEMQTSKLKESKVETTIAAPTNKSSAEAEKITARNNEAIKRPIVGKDGKINLNNVFGLGGFGQELKANLKEPEAAASSAKTGQSQITTQAKNEKAAKERKDTENQSKAETERLNRQNASTSTASAKPSSPASKKEASLDDILGSLNRLNTQMSQLISQQNDLLTKQIRTTKSSSSNSLYDRMAP